MTKTYLTFLRSAAMSSADQSVPDQRGSLSATKNGATSVCGSGCVVTSGREIGGERRLSEGRDGDQRRRAAKDEFHRKAQRSRCLCRRGLQADAVTVERGGLVYRWRSGAKLSLGALSVWSADGRGEPERTCRPVTYGR